MIWNYEQPVAIHFGTGQISRLKEEIEKLGGRRGILITSPSFRKNGTADRLCRDCGGLLEAVYSQVSPNPDVEACEACIRLIREYRCDFVAALGGGSVLDCAKAASVMCMSDRPVRDYMEDLSLLPQNHLPLIAIPTTAGTGSEITGTAVLSDHQKGTKQPLSSPAFYPVTALVDPSLTLSVPPHTTACTGMDVLCHALEAYWSRRHQPVCDALAVHALRLVFRWLRTAFAEPGNAEGREKMAEASVIAGMAFSLPKTTSAHACSYPLTNLFGIPHGEACGLTIDYFLRINIRQDDGRLAQLAHILDFASPTEMADAISRLKQDIGLLTDLKSFQLTPEQTEALVQASRHPNLLNNPVEITEQMLRAMYLALS